MVIASGMLLLLGVHLPQVWLIIIALTSGAYSVFMFPVESEVPMKNPLGLFSMDGMRGRVVSPLVPQGMVKIQGELWKATSEEGDIGVGEEIVVVAQKGLSLTVRRAKNQG